MPKIQKPGVVFQPTAQQHIQKGINQLANALRPTLGPYPRLVANATMQKTRGPELLDDGGLIARRIIQLADAEADMGAMYLRQVLWQLHQRVGDGVATAAVIFQTIFNEGVRYIAAGGNAMLLRRHLEEGQALILATLTGMTRPIRGKGQLAQVAESLCYDPAIAQLFGEIFELIGADGRLDVRAGRGRTVEREYVLGTYWDSKLLSPQLMTDPVRHRADLENAALLITDLEVSHPNQLIPLITAAIGAEIKALVLVVTAIEDSVVGLLRDERTWSKIRVIPVKTPGTGLTDQAAHLEDLALLTGGQPILAVTKAKLENAKLGHLGRAWHAWASADYFGVVGGKGDPAELRRHLARLRRAANHSSDATQRQKLQQRVGQLLGGAAVLSVGGTTEAEIKTTRATLERTAQAMRGAVADGILPGGGMALLACRPALAERYRQSITPDERAAYGMLLRAIEEPLRTLAANAGYEPGAVLAQLNQAPPDHGFDARTGQVVELVTTGVFDIATTQKQAVVSAIAGAALALTIDTLVHSKKPAQSIDP